MSPNPRNETTPDGPSRLRAIFDWLMSQECRRLGAAPFIDAFARALVTHGAPLFRFTTALPTLHPEIFVRSLVWMRGRETEESIRGYSVIGGAMYLNSPVRLIHDGATVVRRKLVGSDAELDFEVLEEIAGLGGTDYVAFPVPSSVRQVSFVSFVSDAKDGFAEDWIDLFRALLPAFSLRLELEASRAMTSDLLGTYLGANTARKVLAGTFLRGQCETIDAALWFSDLRGFTTLTDQAEPSYVIRTLDDYFETLVRAIQDNGGEVLKFIGDGLLAIYRIEDDTTASRERACRQALKAARAALVSLDVLNEGRVAAGDAPLRTGIALHHGPVMYGNIGARDRLDFTVIGRAVNEVARLENLSAKIERPILASAAFAASVKDSSLRTFGFHEMKGLREPREVFGE